MKVILGYFAHFGRLLFRVAFLACLLDVGLLRAADTPDFQQQILPLLYRSCFSCHSEKKAKPEGDLMLDSVAAIRDAVVLVPGAPEESELFKRIALGANDPDLMPPAKTGGVALNADELSLFRRWIEDGADFGSWQAYSHRQPSRAWDAPGAANLAMLTQELDRTVDEYHAREHIKPTSAPIDDLVFARRVYLDVAGRIPTYDELHEFMTDSRADKRRVLIDYLLNSNAYVSHAFNWWADQLRLITEHGGGHNWRLYEQWVKEGLSERKPLDKFVAELVTANGYLWENGAAGFYLRDSGMPLDHMSNLSRVFLGTRMECAQCHDHPTEPITQKDFFQLTAYTHGVSVLNKPHDTQYVKHWEALQKSLKVVGASKVEHDSVSRAVAPLKRFITETDEPLRFPLTYAYDAAARGQPVSPHTFFGDDAPAMPGRNREAFAQWLVSPGNPRFAPNMANRLWKRVMGLGLVEPVDSLSPFTVATDPALLEFLANTLVQVRFDERAFLAVVLNSRAYQRAAVREDVQPGVPAPFRGPYMRRLTAEQVWDSLLGLLVADLDQRQNAERFEKTNKSREYLRGLASMSPDEILARARVEHEFYNVWRHFKTRKSGELAAAIDKAAAAGDLDSAHRLREEQIALDAEERRRREEINLGQPYDAPETDPRWLGLDLNLIRASELQSPADHGHFLRKFGQSDRREIDASSQAPNLPQSLALMNGALTQLVLSEESLLRRTLARINNPHERLTAAYLAVLAREPSAHEREIILRLCDGSNSAEADVLWALLNSPEFLFYP